MRRHADLAEGAKLQQYAKEFPRFLLESSLSLEIISMEAVGARVRVRVGMLVQINTAHQRQMATIEFPTPLQFHRKACFWCSASTGQHWWGGPGSWPRRELLSRPELVLNSTSDMVEVEPLTTLNKGENKNLQMCTSFLFIFTLQGK